VSGGHRREVKQGSSDFFIANNQLLLTPLDHWYRFHAPLREYLPGSASVEAMLAWAEQPSDIMCILLVIERPRSTA
jgi:hypothetical protein